MLQTKAGAGTIRGVIWVVAVAGALNMLAAGIPALDYHPNEALHGVFLALVSSLLLTGREKGGDE